MPRILKDSNLGTRDARLRLKPRGKPYWRLIEPGLHLGYRRLAGRPGSWCVRRYTGAQTYTVEAIKDVVADDYPTPTAAPCCRLRRRRRRRSNPSRRPGRSPSPRRWKTICGMIEARTGVYDASRRVETLILPALGAERVEALTAARLRKWLNDLASSPVRLRTRSGDRQRYADRDEARTADGGGGLRQIACWQFKAALNHAWREGHVASDTEWRRVKPFPARGARAHAT